MPFKWDRVLRPRCLNRISRFCLMDDDLERTRCNAAMSESGQTRLYRRLCAMSAVPPHCGHWPAWLSGLFRANCGPYMPAPLAPAAPS
jgi:hypothetical protein